MRRGALAHAFHGQELVHPRLQHPVQGAEGIQQLMGQGIHVAIGDAVKQHQFQHLVIRKAIQPFPAEAFPHAPPVSIMHAHGRAPCLSVK